MRCETPEGFATAISPAPDNARGEMVQQFETSHGRPLHWWCTTRGQWPYRLASNDHLIDLRKMNNRLRRSNHTLLLKSCCSLLTTSMTSEITYDLGLDVLDLGKVLSHISLASKCHFSQNFPAPLLLLLLKPCQCEPLTC